jgi:hypothetical protein
MKSEMYQSADQPVPGIEVESFRATAFAINVHVADVSTPMHKPSIFASSVALAGPNNSLGRRRYAYVNFYIGKHEVLSANPDGDHYPRYGIESLPTVLSLLTASVSIDSVAVRRNGRLTANYLEISEPISADQPLPPSESGMEGVRWFPADLSPRKVLWDEWLNVGVAKLPRLRLFSLKSDGPQSAEILFHPEPLTGTPGYDDVKKQIAIHLPVAIAPAVQTIIEIARKKSATIVCSAKPQSNNKWSTMLDLKLTKLGPP